MSFELEVEFPLLNVRLVGTPYFKIEEDTRVEKITTERVREYKFEPPARIKRPPDIDPHLKPYCAKVSIPFETSEANYSSNNPLELDPYYREARSQLNNIKSAFALAGYPLKVDQGYVNLGENYPPNKTPASQEKGMRAVQITKPEREKLQKLSKFISSPQNEKDERLGRVGQFVQRGFKFHIFESDPEYAFFNFWRACEISARLLLGDEANLEDWQDPTCLGLKFSKFSSDKKQIVKSTKEGLLKLKPADFEEFDKRIKEFQQNQGLGETLALCYGLRGEIFHYGNTNEAILSILYWPNELLSAVIMPELIGGILGRR